jgi:hypothetical protein
VLCISLCRCCIDGHNSSRQRASLYLWPPNQVPVFRLPTKQHHHLRRCLLNCSSRHRYCPSPRATLSTDQHSTEVFKHPSIAASIYVSFHASPASRPSYNPHLQKRRDTTCPTLNKVSPELFAPLVVKRLMLFTVIRGRVPAPAVHCLATHTQSSKHST